MECIGLRSVRLSALVLPGDMRAICEEPATKQIASSYQWTCGAPAEPVLVDHEMRLRAGKHRVAACMRLKLDSIPAMVFRGTEEELSRLADVENAFRRHDPAARDAAMARLVEQVAVKEPTPFGPPRLAAGRPITPKGQAIREVAKATGSTPAAVASAIRRADAKERTPQPAHEDAPAAPCCIDSLGCVVPPDLAARVAKEHAGLDGIHKSLVSTQASLTRFETDCGHQFQLLKECLHDAAVAARSALPKCVCPWCKDPSGASGRRQQCVGCRGKGYLTEGEARACTDERLWATGNDCGIYRDGKWVAL